MNVNEIITERIIKALKTNTAPWHRPWGGGDHQNVINKIPYSGVNSLLTRISGFSSPFWITAKQAIKHKVRWAGKGTPITYWNWTKTTVINPDTGEQEEKKHGFLRYYLVWNLDQCELPAGFNVPKLEKEFSTMEDAEEWLSAFPIVHKAQEMACYSPSEDRILLPEKKQFFSASAYYATAFHECAHCTGHASRLNRALNNHFGDTSYALEELIAEIASAFTMNRIGLLNETEKNTAAYCQSWIKILENNPSWIIKASSLADKAYKYIIGEKSTEKEEESAA